MAKNPQYKRNTIQEAYCEFRLTPNSAPKWTPKTPGQIFKALGPDKFPGMEPLNEMMLNVVVDANGQAQQQIVPQPPKVKFSNGDDTRLVQVSPVMFAFNVVKDYPGWEKFQELITSNWDAVSPHLEPVAIERIGLRYINRIPAPASSNIADWLKPSRFIPEALKISNPTVKYRFEYTPKSSDAVVINIIRESGGPFGTDIYFDIDYGRNIGSNINSSELKKITDLLHTEIWEIFDSAKAPKLESFLNGKD